MNISNIVSFITTDIWRIQIKSLSRTRAVLIKNLRVVLLAFRGFNENNCQLKASALTFYSLLSIVPVAAMAFGIAKGFGFEKMLEQQLLDKLPGQEDVITQVITFARSMLDTTRGGLVAGIGVAILFWTVIKVLGNIEKAFNDIWGVKEARSMGRKFSDYLSIMLLCPILVIVSGSVTVFIKTQVMLITEKIALIGFFSPVIVIGLKLLPFCILWGLFTFIYIFMPNTKVNLRSGILAGIIAGTVFQLAQGAYITFQIGVAKYNAIYGSFAALPLFLVWLQISWLIVLFGAEISFAHQNVDTYEFEPDCLKASVSFKRTFLFHILQMIFKNFKKGEKPLTDIEISHKTDGPIRLVREILYELVDCGILSEVNIHEDKSSGYQPAKDIDNITIKGVIDIVESKGSDNMPFAQTEEKERLINKLAEFNSAISKLPQNMRIKDI